MKIIHYFVFLATLFAAVSCGKEELEPPVADGVIPEKMEYNTYLTARINTETKASVSEDYKKLSWTVNDTISVYTSKGRFVDFIYDAEESPEEVRFKANLDNGETIGRYAVYPAGNHRVSSEGDVYVNLPQKYEWVEGEVEVPMLAEISDPSETVTFSHVGGVFAFDVAGVPAGATSFEFKASRLVTGDFSVADGKIATLENEVASTVTFTFDALELVEDMKFFVPVPTGSYPGFTITIYGGESSLATKTAKSTNVIERTALKKFSFAASDIIYVTVDGSGQKTGESWENAATLNGALASAGNGSVIRMAGGTYVPDTIISGAEEGASDNFKTFLVNKHVTIQGSYKAGTSQTDTLTTPTIISGKISETVNAWHAMTVAASGDGKTVLRGLTFTGGKPKKATAAADCTTVTTADGVTVQNYRGGGLYVGSSVDLRSCTFTGNTADNLTYTSGTVGVGMYIAAGSVANVSRSMFASNTGGACGGAIYVHGNLNMTDCVFSQNKAAHSGAVHNAGKVYVDRCLFLENEATSGFAGAMRQQGSTFTVANSTFKGNKAKTHGGAIHNNRNTITLDGCIFNENAATKDGGAIANWGGGTATVNTCSFVANTAEYGGAVTNMVNSATDKKSYLILNKCSFIGNAASDGQDAVNGGAVINNGCIAVISGCSFEGFSAESGGAVANLLSMTLVPELTIDKGCVFTKNEASLGGAVANIAGNAEISGTDFLENNALQHGGAVYNAYGGGTSVMSIRSSEFISNTSVKNGGAIMNWYAEDDPSALAPELTISNCEFITNKVTEKTDYENQGGAIANQCSILTVMGTTFHKNYALHSGAIYSYNCLKNTSTLLSDKVAYTYVYNSCFDSNTVGGTAQGSHFRSHGKSKNVIVNSTFTGGNSTTGGLRLRTGATCYLVSCTFTDNGSGPYNQSSVMKVYNTVSYGNSGNKLNYYANLTDSDDLLYSSLIGTMSISGGRVSTGTTLYDAEGNASDMTISGNLFGAYRDGVYSVEAEPAVSKGMTNAELEALANVIKADMPDLEVKYFTRDQKNSPRSECEKVMGAYIGDVYLDPNRDGYINNTEIDDDLNLRGLITDGSGNPVAGVAVSDGYDVVTTDVNGVYQFAAHPDARLLSISVPAEYEIPYKDNRPAFWVSIDPTDYEIRTDFTLKRRTSPADDFTIFSLADTHVKTAEHYSRFSGETMADLASTVNAGNYSSNSFAVILGDIMFDNYEQVENVKASLVDSPVPVFPCFGNHDCSSSVGTTELDLISKYQQHFGPVDYSFNIGKAHVVFMKNMIYEGKEPYGTEGHGYAQGILDHQLEWLRKDLDAVQDKGNKLIIMCVHIPLRGTGNSSKNYKAVVNEMLKFKEAHVLSGHHHGVYNHIPSGTLTAGGKNFYDHNQVAAAGAWWGSHLNPDGSPNGYMIYDISGNAVEGYAFKGTNQDAGYQMRVYNGGNSYSAPFPWWNYHNWTQTFKWSDLGTTLSGKFVVHVFNADTRDWQVNFVQNGVSTPMTRTTEDWYDVASYAFAAYYTDWSSGGSERYSSKTANTNYWYIDAPSGNPASERNWYVEAVHTVNGKTVRYTSSTLHSGYTGFEY